MSFEKKGEKSQKTLVLEAFESAQSGEVVSYEKLGEILKMNPSTQRTHIQSVVNATKKSLLDKQSKGLEAVPNEGYRIIAPNEHVSLAQKHQGKVSRSLKRAKNTVDRADFNKLTEVEKNLVLAAGRALGFQQEQIRKLDIRQQKLEQVLSAFIPAQQEVNAEVKSEIQKLNDRLAELNKKFEQEV